MLTRQVPVQVHLPQTDRVAHIVTAFDRRHGTNMSHAVGLGQMNLHGYLAREHIYYGSEEGLDFTNIYFYTVTYHAIHASMEIAKERGVTFEGFESSKYANGEFFAKYIEKDGNRRPNGCVSCLLSIIFRPAKIGFSLPPM